MLANYFHIYLQTIIYWRQDENITEPTGVKSRANILNELDSIILPSNASENYASKMIKFLYKFLLL